MSDLTSSRFNHPVESAMMQELRAEIERLRAALQDIAQDDTEGVGVYQVIARRALEPKP